MNKNTMLAVAVVIMIVALAVVWWISSLAPAVQQAASSQSSTGQNVGPTDEQMMTLAGGKVSLSYPAETYSLATSPEQILVKPNVPPCDQDFDYCFYYAPGTYIGTNFQSAGLRVARRSDLSTESQCLTAPPAGFSAASERPVTTSTGLYSASTFENVGTASAGHSSEGSLYRLFIKSSATCYEFETRIGISDLANYPSGTMSAFTDADRATVLESLDGILKTIMLVSSGTSVNFPNVM